MNKIITFFRESSLARFLVPAGLMLIIFGTFMFVINSKNQDYVKIEATITDVVLTQEAYNDVEGNHYEATYDVYLTYTVDGTDYNQSLSGLSKYNVGEKMTIYYNPEDPTQITQTKSLILPLGLIAAGIASFIAGIISGIKAVKKYKNTKEEM